MHQASVLALSTIVALSAQIQVCVGVGAEGHNDIIQFIYTHIPKLQRQAENVQFAALFLLTKQEVQNHNQFNFIPHDKKKLPLVNKRCYYYPHSQYCPVPANQRPQNYVVTRPCQPKTTELRGAQSLPTKDHRTTWCPVPANRRPQNYVVPSPCQPKTAELRVGQTHQRWQSSQACRRISTWATPRHVGALEEASPASHDFTVYTFIYL